MNALYRGLAVAGGISAAAFLPVIWLLMGGEHIWGLWGAALVGLGLTAAMVVVTEYYTATEYSPVRKLAEACTTGHATNIIAGLAVSMKATALPVLAVCLSIGLTYSWGGLYGIAIAATSKTNMAVMLPHR